MPNEKPSARERTGTPWRERWRIPTADLGGLLFFFAMCALFFLWLGLSVFGVEAEAVRAAHRLLPQRFFLVNLFLAPALGALVAGPLPLPRALRLALAVLMVCSLSLFLVTPQHQAVGLVMLGLLYLEAFWIIPRWNKRARRGNCRGGTHSAGPNAGANPAPASKAATLPRPRRKPRPRDLILYIIIAAVVVAILVIRVLG